MAVLSRKKKPSNRTRQELPEPVTADSALRGRDIVFLSHQRWNTHVTAVHNTVTRLARHNRVLFVEPPDSAGWLLHEPPAREAMTRVLSPLERKSENFYLYHTPPVFLPCQARSKWIARSVTTTFRWMIQRAMHKAGFHDPVFWIFQFNLVDLVRTMRPACSVYECAEEWASYETRPHVKQYIADMDRALCREVDVVLVPSQKMLEQKQPHNRNTHLVPWGVDLALYGQARSADTELPADLAGIGHPIVGLFGMLDGRRLHTELLTYMARRHADWQIVLVGRCMPNLDTQPLDALPNVHFLGMKPVAQIPAYCKAFDVCMIPYKVNDFTRSIMPLKLAEYLATGKPVITTALPAAEQLRDVVRIADTVEAFEQHVCEALCEDPSLVEARLKRGKEYDWDVLVHRRTEIVADALHKAGVAAAPESAGLRTR